MIRRKIIGNQNLPLFQLEFFLNNQIIRSRSIFMRYQLIRPPASSTISPHSNLKLIIVNQKFWRQLIVSFKRVTNQLKSSRSSLSFWKYGLVKNIAFSKWYFPIRNTEEALILKRQTPNSRISSFRPSKYNIRGTFIRTQFRSSTWLQKSEFQCTSCSFSRQVM